MKLDRKIYDYHEVGHWEGHWFDDDDDEAGGHDFMLEVIAARGGDDGGWRTETPDGEVFGIELELESKSRYYRDDIVNSFPDPEQGDHFMPIFEQDASLYDGVECVFPPLAADVIKNPESYIRRAIEKLRTSRTVKRASNAGMHINVNVAGWDYKSKGIFISVIHSMPLTWITKLAGRKPNDACGQAERKDYWTGRPTTVDDLMDLGGHSYAVELDGNRMECRYPVAKLCPKHLHNNITFLQVLSRFAQEDSEEANSIKYDAFKAWRAFRTWLKKQEDEDALSVAAFFRIQKA